MAPIIGLLVQPLIGHYSDRTWTKLGRRRPYFLVGAIMASIALCLMPNANLLTNLIPPLWVGAGMQGAACLQLLVAASHRAQVAQVARAQVVARA